MKNLIIAIGYLIGAAYLTNVEAEEIKRPNILIVFTDDQGYSDIGCYGSTTNRTPRLDQLAQKEHASPPLFHKLCGPSRSCSLDASRSAVKDGACPPEITFAELMQSVGYQTACIGKWDVSNRKAITERMPNAQALIITLVHSERMIMEPYPFTKIIYEGIPHQTWVA